MTTSDILDILLPGYQPRAKQPTTYLKVNTTDFTVSTIEVRGKSQGYLVLADNSWVNPIFATPYSEEKEALLTAVMDDLRDLELDYRRRHNELRRKLFAILRAGDQSPFPQPPANSTLQPVS